MFVALFFSGVPMTAFPVSLVQCVMKAEEVIVYRVPTATAQVCLPAVYVTQVHICVYNL